MNLLQRYEKIANLCPGAVNLFDKGNGRAKKDPTLHKM